MLNLDGTQLVFLQVPGFKELQPFLHRQAFLQTLGRDKAGGENKHTVRPPALDRTGPDRTRPDRWWSRHQSESRVQVRLVGMPGGEAPGNAVIGGGCFPLQKITWMKKEKKKIRETRPCV